MFGVKKDSEAFSLVVTAITGLVMTLGVFMLWCRATVGKFTSTVSLFDHGNLKKLI